MKVLVFDIWGQYAHYKKIYATTSAVSFVIPPKTSLYGYIGAILGLEKEQNAYLGYFQDKCCLMAIKVCRPIVMQRINTNLRPNLGRIVKNRKPTTIEYVYQPRYRVYFTHQDLSLYQRLQQALIQQSCVFTPTLGLANLLSKFEYQGEFNAIKHFAESAQNIHSVIPKEYLIKFSADHLVENGNEIIEQGMYTVEMNRHRETTERTDIILDRTGKAIPAYVTHFYKVDNTTHDNIILF